MHRSQQPCIAAMLCCLSTYIVSPWPGPWHVPIIRWYPVIVFALHSTCPSASLVVPPSSRGVLCNHFGEHCPFCFLVTLHVPAYCHLVMLVRAWVIQFVLCVEMCCGMLRGVSRFNTSRCHSHVHRLSCMLHCTCTMVLLVINISSSLYHSIHSSTHLFASSCTFSRVHSSTR